MGTKNNVNLNMSKVHDAFVKPCHAEINYFSCLLKKGKESLNLGIKRRINDEVGKYEEYE